MRHNIRTQQYYATRKADKNGESTICVVLSVRSKTIEEPDGIVTTRNLITGSDKADVIPLFLNKMKRISKPWADAIVEKYYAEENGKEVARKMARDAPEYKTKILKDESTQSPPEDQNLESMKAKSQFSTSNTGFHNFHLLPSFMKKIIGHMYDKAIVSEASTENIEFYMAGWVKEIPKEWKNEIIKNAEQDPEWPTLWRLLQKFNDCINFHGDQNVLCSKENWSS